MNRPSRARIIALCPVVAVLIFSTLASALAQRSNQKPATQTSTATKPLELSYTIAFPRPHTHLYKVELTIANVSTPQLDMSLPTWTPGSYLQREYARHVQDFAATDGPGQTLRWQKIDKATWRIEANAAGDKPKTIRASYRVYANELFTQTSHLDATHAYFNGASLFIYLPGAKDRPHRVRFTVPQGWRVTTPLALAPDVDGYYTAADYDRLIDSPTEIGTHRLLEFS